ncbi:hypothetical protein [Methylobacterium platani]|uniref:RiboL-PSP-HEPN domain-containing protein n=2 Tax=Methylobacterium platani TaxID=427683 RepID=A0A179SFB3_9HYPH|nr:hypothetical protein [Methylobacterium platani]KMO14187.1 hypothetical protein SQ03_20040 [Methylobacterium platani JCM 14648]OAS26566.1 hypothetical protein A5481_05835 [Methylobacterium platani]
MKDLAAITAVYSEFATSLDAQLVQAERAADIARIGRVEHKQRIHDSAYFILIWGQLEAEINRVAELAVRNRRSSIRWEDRRAWDAHDPENMRAKFEDRAALVLDRLNVASDAYRRTIRYYGLRNGIAHGATLATGIDVPTIIGDLYRIAGELKA